MAEKSECTVYFSKLKCELSLDVLGSTQSRIPAYMIFSFLSLQYFLPFEAK